MTMLRTRDNILRGQGCHTSSKTISHTFSILSEKTLMHHSSSFSENFIQGTQCKTIWKAVISDEEQNMNKQMSKCGISILFQYFLYILAKFNTSRSGIPISQFNTFNTA